MRSRHAMPFSAELRADGSTRFRLWAPAAPKVELRLEHEPATPVAMQALGDGWHETIVHAAGAGTRYRYAVGDGLLVPDPASRFNPLDVAGPSEVVDPLAYEWRDARWRGRPWQEAVVYELHVGSFTREGSFDAAAHRLPELARLGITAVELMPLADFPGRRGWGYDGVLPFAPDAAYGTPQQLKAFVDAAHALGLMVLLDVVYNHFGPEGNHLHAYCPAFFNPAKHTPWGAAINFDGADSRPVRDFFVHNVLHWVEEYHFDGLRLDAVHAIEDESPEHIVCEIGRALREGPGRDREVHLVLENDDNRARWLTRDERATPRCASAQWNDDIHHAAHRVLTAEADGYYADYGADADQALDRFGRALAEGFVYQGEASPFRGGQPRGEPSAALPPSAFVSFLQNHDQVGNRAFGERLSALADAARLDAAYACLLLAPQVPMLFMGEEFAASTPFLYFCDFHAELGQAVTNGRRAEFARFAAFADEAARERIPDPNDPATFAASRLRWSERRRDPHRQRLRHIEALLARRREHLVPRLGQFRSGGRHRVDGAVLQVEWPLADGSVWRMQAHFGTSEVVVPAVALRQTVWSHGIETLDDGRLRLTPAAVQVGIGQRDG